jgi:hypothetical protein
VRCFGIVRMPSSTGPTGRGQPPRTRENNRASSISARRIREQQHIGAQEANCADQVRCLTNSAMMVIAMIVPALCFKILQEPAH